jgi:hypothetical protein
MQLKQNQALTLVELVVVAGAAASVVLAQGTFQYDQQSINHSIPPNLVYDIQGNEPIGQSFTPLLSSVGFVQLEPFDGNPNNGLGATLYVNLRSNSITGPILGSTDPVFLPDIPSGGGVTNFLFSTPVSVVPGITYFFEVVVQSGDFWTLNTLGANDYSRGAMFLQGVAQPLNDLWFREGVIVPEPSTAALLVAAGALLCVRRKKSHPLRR